MFRRGVGVVFGRGVGVVFWVSWCGVLGGLV